MHEIEERVDRVEVELAQFMAQSMELLNLEAVRTRRANEK